MSLYRFQAILIRPEGVGTWTFLSIPLEISASFKTKGQAKVQGTINGFPFRSTALPMGDGTHYLVVGKEIRQHIHAEQGDTVAVELGLDTEERRVVIPDELQQALDKEPKAATAFENMTYSHKREWINWILSAKQAETRQRRVERAIPLILQAKSYRALSSAEKPRNG